MRKLLGVVSILLTIFMLPAYSGENMEHMPPIKGSAEFNRIKSLAGKWEGTAQMGKGEQKVSAEYKLTSNGSAVLEVLFPGTPHEMVSVYHDINGKLSMTHYCALGNRPLLELESSSDNGINLLFAARNEIDPAKDAHMHALAITFQGDNAFTQTWTSLADGSKQESHTFIYKRIK